MSVKKSAAVIAALCITLALSAPLAACAKDGGGEACTHAIVTKVAQKDADCTSAGNFAHYKCKDCGELFLDSTAETPVTKEEITLEKRPHSAQKQNETAGSYSNFYYCTGCGAYFTDQTCNTEIPYSELVDDTVTPVKFPALSNYGNVFTTKSYDSASELEDISGDFTIRMFIGWTNVEGKSIDEFPDGARVQTNYNLNRLETLQGQGWYNFGIGYTNKSGLTYQKLQSGGNAVAKSEFTALFREKGGIYVRIARRGATVSFYFEDSNGKPRFMDSNDAFNQNGVLIRFAANKLEGEDGWLPFVKDAAICIGSGNPRCVFDK